jgi:hypothetical protein
MYLQTRRYVLTFCCAKCSTETIYLCPYFSVYEIETFSLVFGNGRHIQRFRPN